MLEFQPRNSELKPTHTLRNPTGLSLYTSNSAFVVLDFSSRQSSSRPYKCRLVELVIAVVCSSVTPIMRCWTTLLSLGDAGQTLRLFANVFFAGVLAGAFFANLLRRHALSDERVSAPPGSVPARMARGWHCTLLPETAAASCAIVVINYDLSKANKLRPVPSAMFCTAEKSLWGVGQCRCLPARNRVRISVRRGDPCHGCPNVKY